MTMTLLQEFITSLRLDRRNEIKVWPAFSNMEVVELWGPMAIEQPGHEADEQLPPDIGTRFPQLRKLQMRKFDTSINYAWLNLGKNVCTAVFD